MLQNDMETRARVLGFTRLAVSARNVQFMGYYWGAVKDK